MALENDIHQQAFRTEYQKAIINLIFTFNWMNEKLNRRFEPFDITQQQFNILRILRGSGEAMSTLEIRQRMLDKMSDTSRLVDRLVKKGLVRKTVRTGDRRLIDVLLTEKGGQLLHSMDALNTELDSIFHNLTTEEAVRLNQLLDKIRNPSDLSVRDAKTTAQSA